MKEMILDIGMGMCAVQAEDGLYELLDADGEPIAQGKWSCVFKAAEGIALAMRRENGGHRVRAYYIRNTGQVFHEGDWMLSGCFSEGMAVSGDWLENENRVQLHYFDPDGRIKIRLDSRWREARGFHEGLAAVAEGDPYRLRWGYINQRGELAIKPQWEYAGDFSGGLAIVERERRYAVINREGRVLAEDMECYPPDALLDEIREGM